jgi:hypothetical protein
MSDNTLHTDQYWLAIRKSPESGLDIYGPFTRDAALEHRKKSLDANPKPAVVSNIFKASNLDEARRHAPYFMPPG